ncbi:aldo/keto reductase [Paenibacillus glycanilyticus]|uniref:Aldo/keto reductase n=1 Tax=Paenibacillus glycanilyticus TaxID=126569 RepID=A0ABQ6GBV5_9BACL|nr:aldo/keto reductase [Paenibacillus glycanilyticus]GLX67071.1 aldo/keto reductase [Paenibacillus glycanilyticus]
MEYRILGKSNLRVSEVSLGCWAIGGPSWRDGEPVGWSGNDDNESLAGLRRAHDLGINHLDTADVYGDGHSERVIGRFLKDVPRDSVVVASKVGWFRGTAPNAMQPVHIRHQLEQTLTNLGTDYVDLFYFHNTNFGPEDLYLEEAADTMRELQKEGKIRVIGQSAYSYADFMRVCPVTRPDVLQFHYNAFGSEFDRQGTNLFKWAQEQNLGMVMFGPLAQGLLLDKFDPDNPPQFGEGDIRSTNQSYTKSRLLEIRKQLQPIKEHLGHETQDLVRVAIQYALAQSPNACVIPGFKNTRQVESNAGAAGKPLTAQEVELIRQALQS